MGGNHPSDDPRPSTVTTLLNRAKSWLTASPTHLGYAVVLAALLVSIPFGGLRAAPEDAPEHARPGQVVSAAPWAITFDEVQWGGEPGGDVSRGPEGSHLVLIRGTVRNTTDRTLFASELASSLRVTGLDGVTSSVGLALRDGLLPDVGTVYVTEDEPKLLVGLAPGIDYPVGLAVYAPGSAPDTLSVQTLVKTERLSSLENTMLWTDAVDGDVVDLPVRQAPDGAAATEGQP